MHYTGNIVNISFIDAVLIIIVKIKLLPIVQ